MSNDAFGFARTKVQPPRLRAGLLARPALAGRLATALRSCRLTLVSAPGGFGKSSAMLQALAEGRLAHTWVSCDVDDRLPRLAAAIAAALEPFDLPWRQDPEALVATIERPDGPRAFRDALVNALAVTEVERAVLVLDDVHRLTDEPVHELLAPLAWALPPAWGLAVLARVDPPWPLARLRAAGELAEFRQDDLRFSAEEVKALAGDSAPALLARTEGWPVGVTLALGNAAAAQPVRSERHAVDYLRSEVLDALPADLRDFLVCTSVLPELTAMRTAAVTARADTVRLLDEVERRGLFYQEVDNAERTLRLHDIFRSALDAERRLLPPSEQQALWHRAAETEPDVARRFDSLLQAGDPGGAADTLCAEAPTLVAASGLQGVLAMLARLPPALVEHSPRIALLRGILAWEAVDLQAMCDQMKRAVSLYDDAGDTEGRDLARAYAALAINALSPIGNPRREPAYDVEIGPATPHRTRVIVALHLAWHAFDLSDFEATNRHYGEVFDHLARERDPALWYQVTPGNAYFGNRALEPLLLRFADGALRVAGDDYPALRGTALAVRGCQLLWRGDTAAARAALDEAMSLWAWCNHPQTLATYALTGWLLCRAVQGEIDAAVAGLHDALQRVDGLFGADGRGPGWYFHWYELRCALMAERDDLARQALASLRRTAPGTMNSSHTGVARVVDAYDCWLDGDTARAAALMDDARRYYGANDAQGLVTALGLQRAGLALDEGDDAAAATALVQTLGGLPERGFEMSMLFAGRGRLQRLVASRAARALGDAQRTLLESAAGASPAPAPAAPADGGEAMSARELEVLAQLAAGDSNKVIARQLGLSPHTVKRHVANILGKLGVQSRGQAAARYRQLAV
ncbi:LuxR C-terminal-related transcriptional regulator [Ideonella sp.]|uniref:LuxR C-terminal-related transcriptional regulator n=1 Tax=Ideonella sp. TaxID=1929293 RepID=UPI002B45AEB5|nr:LuxR C-terminal-related transcriptional regulator [Ideonella sp.]HJV67708.1 LuxR C-terminal-related transcriptional regulator [Ideonella sp.]